MKNWSVDLPGMKCPWADDLADAKRVAVRLGIDFKVFDFEKDYKQKVVNYMIDEYKNGRTPNPDVMCNQEVKFKLFLEAALEDGADMIATGHYARVNKETASTLVDSGASELLERLCAGSDKSCRCSSGKHMYFVQLCAHPAPPPAAACRTARRCPFRRWPPGTGHKQGVAGQEGEDHQTGLTEDDQEEDHVNPGSVLGRASSFNFFF